MSSKEAVISFTKPGFKVAERVTKAFQDRRAKSNKVSQTSQATDGLSFVFVSDTDLLGYQDTIEIIVCFSLHFLDAYYA